MFTPCKDHATSPFSFTHCRDCFPRYRLTFEQGSESFVKGARSLSHALEVMGAPRTYMGVIRRDLEREGISRAYGWWTVEAF